MSNHDNYLRKSLVILAYVLLLALGGVVAWRLVRPGTDLPQREFTVRLLGGRPVHVLPQDHATILMVGDIMFARNVASAIAKAHDPLLPFRNLSDLLTSSDLNVANLESPYSRSSYQTPTGSLVFNAPTSTAEGLRRNNFRVINLANNHALDQGEAGLEYTRLLLQDLGLQTYGTRENQDAAWTPVVVNVKGTKIGFVGGSYASINDGGKSRNEFVARVDDLERVKAAVESLRSQADIVIATMHAGTEYTTEPNATQKNFARSAIDAGADLVIGHHPHWVQTIEKYKGKYIFYSLGNFIFDQEWSKNTKQGLVVKLTLDNKTLTSAELVPIQLENYCCPRPATKEESQIMLDRIHATTTRLRL